MSFWERLFGKKEEEAPKERQVAIVDQEAEQEEAITLLKKDDRKAVDRVISDVEGTIQQATRASLRDVKLLEEGRCPSCGRKTRQFLFTVVCEYCGWSSFLTPEKGHATLHLKDGKAIEAQRVIPLVQGDVLCITNDVVQARVPEANVSRIEYGWTEEEIAERREQRQREEQIVCQWCRQSVRHDEYVAVTYCAFGLYQERFFFCRQSHKQAFQNHYPMRIHRNCYETDCSTHTDECLKQFEDAETKEELEIKKERPGSHSD